MLLDKNVALNKLFAPLLIFFVPKVPLEATNSKIGFPRPPNHEIWIFSALRLISSVNFGYVVHINPL